MRTSQGNVFSVRA